MNYRIEKCNLKVKSDLFRKAVSVQSLLDYDNHSNIKVYDVDYILRLNENDYNKFKNSLLYDFDFIIEIGQLTNKTFVVTTENNDIFNDLSTGGSLLVSHEGYSYARYSGLVFDVVSC